MKTVAKIISISAMASAVLSALPSHALSINLPKDTLVKLRFTDPVSTRTAAVGQQVNMRIADDVYLGTKLIIQKDEAVLSTITEVQKPRSWGRSGKLNLEFGTVKAVDGTEISLGPWSQDKKAGIGKAAGATVGGAIILGPVGLVGGMFVKGKHIDVPAGQEVLSAVRWDTTVKIPDVPIQPVEAPSVKTDAATASPTGPLAPAPIKIQEEGATTNTNSPSTPAPVSKTAIPGQADAALKASGVKSDMATVDTNASANQLGTKIPAPAKAQANSTASPGKSSGSPLPGLQKPSMQSKPIIPVIEDVTPGAGAAKKR